MIMRELIEPLGYTPDQLADLDEYMPGWQELTPVEFQAVAAKVTDELRRGVAETRRIIEELNRPAVVCGACGGPPEDTGYGYPKCSHCGGVGWWTKPEGENQGK
jgi:hypothetical protein